MLKLFGLFVRFLQCVPNTSPVRKIFSSFLLFEQAGNLYYWSRFFPLLVIFKIPCIH